MPENHSIQKQVFEFNCSDANEGKALLSWAEEVYYDKVLPQIEEVFDALSIDGIDIEIDHLELDLGTLSTENLKSELPKLVANAIRKAISDMKIGSNSGQNEQFRVIPKHLNQLEALKDFLSKGIAPWWLPQNEFRPWDWFAQAIEDSPDEMRHFFGALSSGKATATSTQMRRARTVGRSSSSNLSSFSSALARIAAAPQANVLNLLFKLVLGDSKAKLAAEVLSFFEAVANLLRHSRQEIWQLRTAFLFSVLRQAKSLDFGNHFYAFWEESTSNLPLWKAPQWQLIRQIIRNSNPEIAEALAIQLGIKRQETEAIFQFVREKQSAFEPVFHVLKDLKMRGEEVLEEPFAGIKKAKIEESESSTKPKKTGIEGPLDLKNEKATAEESGDLDAFLQSLQNQNEPPKESEAFWIENGGLVLVAAFLPNFFANLGLLENEQFKDDATQQKAIHLLRLLSHGAHEVEEHQLIFNKLLCGLPIDAPLDMRFEATAEDLASADELLQAVISYWPILGEISPDQLRGGFLLREAWLSPASNGWKLRIDRKTYDVVLEHLPWAIGIVALPWLRYQIWTEW